ncbi:hypothetical protein Csac_0658 [Caldicellulosiruptor saccharolyticus DSM 8903]|uniref:Uncharacterized protein n=1 Tax=Caldicellulosiruptor saccharolyticus (strain ATCC 43494 / DSM 8903 / Tp8T 6331) TaxID=351627 RepID=A4XH93_CALS8|nr:HlyD family efflux transporter periplasmic adaptor subunit [Caldicellulosiruptor saccharolyticus]ABP66278.1 hypothetical protein Csac_0658 [Caldicellulosiruptor saccharolyticus DSM 8903]
MRFKKGISLFVFVIVCIVILIVVNVFTKSIKTRQAEKMQNENVVKVIKRDLDEETTLRGVVTSEEIPIFSPVTAKVKNVFIKENNYVKKGDLIAILDDTKIRLEIKRKEREKQSLYKDLESLYTRLGECSVYSPFEGQVLEVYVKEKDVISKGSPICKVSKTDLVYLTVAFPKWLFKNIKQGDPIEIILHEFGQEIKGYVRSKSSVFYTDENGFPAFDVEVVLKERSIPLKARAFCIFEYNGQKVRSLNDGIITAEEDVIKSPTDGVVKSIYISKFSQINKNQLIIELSDDEITEQIENKKTQIEQIEEEISEYRKELSRFVIKATLDGIVSDVNIVEGKILNEGEKLAVIWNPYNLIFESKISELELDRIKKGQKVMLQFKIPGRIGVQEIINGTVEMVGSKPLEESKDTNISFYPVKIGFKSDRIKRGMHATAQIKVLIKQNALCIPVEALREENGKYYVWVKKQKTKNITKKTEKDKIVDEYGSKESYYNDAEKREVIIGESNKRYAEILKGLKEGEEVVLPQAYEKDIK